MNITAVFFLYCLGQDASRAVIGHSWIYTNIYNNTITEANRREAAFHRLCDSFLFITWWTFFLISPFVCWTFSQAACLYWTQVDVYTSLKRETQQKKIWKGRISIIFDSWQLVRRGRKGKQTSLRRLHLEALETVRNKYKNVYLLTSAFHRIAWKY